MNRDSAAFDLIEREAKRRRVEALEEAVSELQRELGAARAAIVQASDGDVGGSGEK